MHLEAELVHAEPGQRIVRVSAYQGSTVLGRSLGEGVTAEEAEDRARQRILGLLGPQKEPIPEPIPVPEPVLKPEPTTKPEQIAKPPKESLKAPVATAPNNEPASSEPASSEPEDWSSELARLDLQLQRLGWGRDEEAIYLERVFGHPSRNRLTNFADLMAYLQALEPMEPGQDPASVPVPLRRKDLLEQCDQLLQQLQWDAGQGRAFLEQHFSLTSRQQLNDSQLLQFNMLLESELIESSNQPGGNS
ncbi:hypothetical protein KBY58_12430 [Cyanobium sp. HWJ4-Hawea]|uniref:hypothetical protein n=1 Tax=Cyanobium sp. HWJ4-Hawea TaxID=2823713 RepID=UPI0020CEFD40|nr:hypothetical protein [Cyanobium sp. HWJ4-Hawea]MCP9810235.1 hypothetical protein [Cyanobium sp. HWJ4-Hawea]